jgi:hypothetical protein
MNKLRILSSEIFSLWINVFGIVSIMLFSCTQSGSINGSDFIDRVLDVAIEARVEESVEFRGLYDHLAENIPEDNEESLILVDRLKLRGFEVKHRGRGNYPPLGPRIVIVEMQKEDCICSVRKIYYATTHDWLYEMAEGISCSDAK